jgi:hypothetical protein
LAAVEKEGAAGNPGRKALVVQQAAVVVAAGAVADKSYHAANEVT